MPDPASLAARLAEAALGAKAAINGSDGGARNTALSALADLLLENRGRILRANRRDLKGGAKEGLSAAMLDRLALDAGRVDAMARGVRDVAALPDPAGMVLDGWVRPNGLRISRVRVPLGVILMIYESRPNVTVDAAALCLKSANACILRGGREALATNLELGLLVSEALKRAGLPPAGVQVVDVPDRELVPHLLALDGCIDLAVPRGGRGLVQTVMRHARMPVLKHLDGVCHVYVDASADLAMAERIAVHAKVDRPSTCNAMETLLVHKDVSGAFLPRCLAKLAAAGVEIRADRTAAKLAGKTKTVPAADADWDAEYNDMILSVAVVPDLSAAIRHINAHGSRHTDAIVASGVAAVERFKREVDSGSVMVNTTTRFADGFEYGLGAEIGISTDKLHARGPVGLEGLTTYKWLVEGNGQLR